MPLTELQRAFLRNYLVSKANVVDPDTGDLLDWDSLGLTEESHALLDHVDLPGVPSVDASMSILLREALGDTTHNINTATYPAAEAWREFRVDFEAVLWTEFRIWLGWAQSNAAGASVFLRLDHNSGGLNALSGNADDLEIPNTRGHYSSLWLPITRDMSAAGLATLHLSMRGSNSTVDLIHQGIGVSFRRRAA